MKWFTEQLCREVYPVACSIFTANGTNNTNLHNKQLSVSVLNYPDACGCSAEFVVIEGDPVQGDTDIVGRRIPRQINLSRWGAQIARFIVSIIDNKVSSF